MTAGDFPCPVCGAEAHRAYLPDTIGDRPVVFGYKWDERVREHYRFVRCRPCRHVWASPRPGNIYAHYTSVADPGYLANAALRRATARRVLDTLRRHAPSGRLLDIGCGTGDFLDEARGHYEVEGLELAVWAAEIARAKGLRVHERLVAEMPADGPGYQVATLWGVIEHFEHPLEEMRRINRLLAPDGLVALWTGDVDSVESRLLRDRWWYVMGQHMHLFSRASLAKLMKLAGFAPLHRGVYPYVISFDYLGTRLQPVLGPLAKSIFHRPSLRERTISLYLPGEIFDVWRKIRNV